MQLPHILYGYFCIGLHFYHSNYLIRALKWSAKREWLTLLYSIFTTSQKWLDACERSNMDAILLECIIRTHHSVGHDCWRRS